MAGKAKRVVKRRAEPAAVVDLDLWGALLGLTEPTDEPDVPERDKAPGEATTTHAGEVEGKEAAGTAKVTRRKAGQGSRCPNRALKKRGSSAGDEDEHDQCGTVGGRGSKQVRRRSGQEPPRDSGPDQEAHNQPEIVASDVARGVSPPLRGIILRQE